MTSNVKVRVDSIIYFFNGPNLASFSFFSHDKYSTNLTISEKNIHAVVLGTQTQGGRMVGAAMAGPLIYYIWFV